MNADPRSSPITALLVEDDVDIADSLIIALHDFSIHADHVTNAKDCLGALKRHEPDLILLDLELPGPQGHEICAALRSNAYKRTPIIALSGCQDDSAIVRVLDAGADDFVAKSQAIPVLVAHIRAVLNRAARLAESRFEGGALTQGPVKILTTSHQVLLDNSEISLTPTEYHILEVFVSSPGVVFTRTMMIEQLHGEGYSLSERTIDVHINSLRTRLGKHRTLLETVRGVGYRFGSPVEPPRA